MNISKFFIDRPIFAAVISLLIMLLGLLSMGKLPIAEYPEVSPPSIIVTATYPGANSNVIAETVAAPLEEQINGVEGMIYMSSLSTADGAMALTVTFKIGTNADLAQQLVQNRVSQALPRLPDIVRTLGVTVVKSSADLTMVVHMTSPDNSRDALYLRNYANLNIKDKLARLDGIGQISIFGSGDYAMRLWLDPNKIAERGMSAAEVINAVREQNVQVAAGSIGGMPSYEGVEIQMPVTAKGRLTTEEEFGNIIVKTSPTGAITRLKDVARIELGAGTYSLGSMLNNKNATGIGVFQTPDANALDVSDHVRAMMKEVSKTFPKGVSYDIIYDPTTFVRDSISAVVHTLFEAIALVVVVVILFLRTWRASIIPLLAVPISIIGTFAFLHLLGFSINALSLFGLVLAIGIVVDDAIVVVENVERNIQNGLHPHAATYQAMREVSGPIIAIALVLIAVFVPIAFITGLTGQFYRQFAVTITISTIISAFNSLTLSPALAALLLKEHDAKPDALTRFMEKYLGWLFDGFNNLFVRGSEKYRGTLRKVAPRKFMVIITYICLIGFTYFAFNKVPVSYVPAQDKAYLIAFAQLPPGSTLDRTEAIMKRMGDIGLKDPAVANAVQFPGLSIAGFSSSPSEGIVFFPLKPFAERKGADMSAQAAAGRLMGQFMGVKEAFIAVFPPPPVRGLGTTGGFKLEVEDRADLGFIGLNKVVEDIVNKARQAKELQGVYSNFKISDPQLDAEVNREQAKRLGMNIEDIFGTMQVYLGSLYINDFNKFGRTYQVIAQADAKFRAHPEDILRLKTKNAAGEMIPLGSVLSVKEGYGPSRATRYNSYPAADINGDAAPGYSAGQAKDAIEKIINETAPKGVTFEWTDLTYQQILAGNTTMYVFPICVLLVFMVLAAMYESLTLPLVVILIVPMCLLSAITGVWIAGNDNNIFTQIGFIVLVGLACKNAILIVEFARELEINQKLSPFEAAIEASRLRLRPILMTSIAFIMGVLPLVMASGAGAEMRNAMGVAVFAGMIGVTFFGLFFTPVFYTILRKFSSSPHHAGAINEAAE